MLWTFVSSMERGQQFNVCSRLLKYGIFAVTLMLHCGNCDKPTPTSSINLQQHSHHSPWEKWANSETSILPWDAPQMPNIVPLTLREQKDREKRALRKSQNQEKSKSWEGSRKNGGSNKIKSSKQSESKGKGKSGSRADYSEDSTASVDLVNLREKALDFGSLVADFLGQQILAKPNSGGEGRGARGILSDFSNKFQIDRQEGGGEGGDRGVIDWLARLIGVQGKTLGEFLREYQVHVLYDLVFTFFKWIFFLYAGLLIP